jgi:hypothetical protein
MSGVHMVRMLHVKVILKRRKYYNVVQSQNRYAADRRLRSQGCTPLSKQLPLVLPAPIKTKWARPTVIATDKSPPKETKIGSYSALERSGLETVDGCDRWIRDSWRPSNSKTPELSLKASLASSSTAAGEP